MGVDLQHYAPLNELTSEGLGPWRQPEVLIDSVDLAEIVALQERGEWDATGMILADSARPLEAAGAMVLAICANTMHASAPWPAVDSTVAHVRGLLRI